MLLIGLLTLSVMGGIALPAAAVESAEIAEYKLMSQNLWIYGTTGEYDAKEFDRRPMMIRRIREQSPDIITFQEMNTGWTDYLLSNSEFTSNYTLHYKYRKSDNKEAVPVAFKTSKFKVLESGHFWFSDTPDKESAFSDAYCHRICSWMVLEDKSNGEKIGVYSVHMDLYESARNKSTPILLERINAIKEKYGDIMIIAAGDYNCKKGSTCYNAMIDAGYGDARFLAPVTSSEPTAPPSNIIDFIMVNNTVGALEFSVLSDNYNSDGYVLSDHNGITMRFCNANKVEQLLIDLESYFRVKDASYFEGAPKEEVATLKRYINKEINLSSVEKLELAAKLSKAKGNYAVNPEATQWVLYPDAPIYRVPSRSVLNWVAKNPDHFGADKTLLFGADMKLLESDAAASGLKVHASIDGGGHKVSGVNIATDGIDQGWLAEKYQGQFVKNLVMDGWQGSFGAQDCGLLIGSAQTEKLLIENVTVQNCSAKAVSPVATAGLLIGSLLAVGQDPVATFRNIDMIGNTLEVTGANDGVAFLLGRAQNTLSSGAGHAIEVESVGLNNNQLKGSATADYHEGVGLLLGRPTTAPRTPSVTIKGASVMNTKVSADFPRVSALVGAYGLGNSSVSAENFMIAGNENTQAIVFGRSGKEKSCTLKTFYSDTLSTYWSMDSKATEAVKIPHTDQAAHSSKLKTFEAVILQNNATAASAQKWVIKEGGVMPQRSGDRFPLKITFDSDFRYTDAAGKLATAAPIGNWYLNGSYVADPAAQVYTEAAGYIGKATDKTALNGNIYELMSFINNNKTVLSEEQAAQLNQLLADARSVAADANATQPAADQAAETLLQWKELPADYAAVDAAIAAAEGYDEALYANFDAVTAALNKVVRGKKITEQSIVASMADAIQQAIAKLEKKSADYAVVDAAIASANALNPDHYMNFGAVTNAIDAVDRSKGIDEQAAVDGMAKAINDAIAALEMKPADYAAVDAAIAAADALNQNDYKNFSAVTNAINAVVRGKKINEQAAVDEMAKAINDAIAALEMKPADYAAVDAAIAAANQLYPEDYIDFSAVTNAINAVVRGKKINEQAAVDAMAKAINDAIAALQKSGADYAAVDAAIAAANALNQSYYEDFSAVTDAIHAVVRGKKKDEQAAVDAMAKAINDAIAALEMKPADYAAVDAAITAAGKLNPSHYEDFSAVNNAINAVIRGKKINEQTAVDAMAKAINDAIAALEMKPADYLAVDSAIRAVLQLKATNYINYHIVSAAVNAVDRSKKINEQAAVDAMANAIYEAIAALEMKPADYAAVDAAIAAADALIGDYYSNFSAVTAAIDAVDRSKKIVDQNEVDAMAKAINDAIAALEMKPADYAAVDAAIRSAEALDPEAYKDFSKVTAAIDAVVRGKLMDEQAAVNQMAQKIRSAIDALALKDAEILGIKGYDTAISGDQISLQASGDQMRAAFEVAGVCKGLNVYADEGLKIGICGIGFSNPPKLYAAQTLAGLRLGLANAYNVYYVELLSENGSRRVYQLIIRKEVAAVNYADVPKGGSAWYTSYVYEATQMGCVTGTKSGSKWYFNPNGQTTREQMATIMTKVKGLNVNYFAGVKLPFADQSKISDWAVIYMKAAYQTGLISGSKKNNKLYANAKDYVTRQEAVVMMVAAIGCEHRSVDLSGFKDYDEFKGSWAEPYLQTAVALGLISGKSGKLAPKSFITRAELAVILKNMKKYM